MRAGKESWLPGAQLVRETLEREFSKRKKSNHRYSLRAYARALRLDPSTLSKMMKGRRPLGAAASEKIMGRLSLPDAERNRVLSLLEDSSCHDFRKMRAKRYVALGEDQFTLISNWCHYAILELLGLPTFESDPKWIARALRISPLEARLALDRLLRLGLIAYDEAKNRYVDRSGGRTTTLGPERSAAAFREMQRQILEQALQALKETPYEERDQSSLTLAMDPARIPEIRALLKKFRRKLNQFAIKTGTPSEVYQVSLSIFPVTRIGKGKKE